MRMSRSLPESVAPEPEASWAPEVAAAPAPALAAEPVKAAADADASGEVAELQRLAVDALMEAKGQTTAADAIADAEWSLAGDTVTIQTEVSKIMLPTVVNAEAEKIVRAAVVKQTPGLARGGPAGREEGGFGGEEATGGGVRVGAGKGLGAPDRAGGAAAVSG